MQSKIINYNSAKFGTLSTIHSDSGVWYFGKSIANALNMSDPTYRKFLKSVEDSGKRRAGELCACKDPHMVRSIYINEDGAERLIRASENKPKAMLYCEWMWSQIHPGETPPEFGEETAIKPIREIDMADSSSIENNPILKFTSEVFGDIRVVEIDGEPWFVGRDVAKILGYGGGNEDSKAISNAIADHVDKDDKKRCPYWVFESHQNAPLSESGRRGLMVINEPGLYALIMGSTLPAARDFKRWVTHDVLPSVRKRGVYATDDFALKAISDPDFAIRVFTEIKAEREKNRLLTERAAELSAANDALAEQAMIWDDRSVLNALVRAYSNRVHNNVFAKGWNSLYKAAMYDLGINLKNRIVPKGRKGLIDTITQEEFPKIIKLAAAMCQRANIDVGKIINEVNAERCGV